MQISPNRGSAGFTADLPAGPILEVGSWHSLPSTHFHLWGNLMPDNHWGKNAIEVRFAE